MGSRDRKHGRGCATPQPHGAGGRKSRHDVLVRQLPREALQETRAAVHDAGPPQAQVGAHEGGTLVPPGLRQRLRLGLNQDHAVAIIRRASHSTDVAWGHRRTLFIREWTAEKG